MLQVALLVLALSVLVRTVAGLDIDETTSELTDAWPLVGLAFITAQAPRLTQRNHLAPPGELLVDASRKVPEGGLVP